MPEPWGGQSQSWEVPQVLDGERIDRAISLITELSRREVNEVIESGRVSLGSRVVDRPSRRVRAGEKLVVAGSLEPRRHAVMEGEPDVEILDDGGTQIRVKVNGVDVFDPNTGDIRSNDIKGIAAWFIDTDYNEESFFVRHAYFLGANDPYKSLRTALQADIDEDAWASLYSDTSRSFARPANRRIAVKVINHFGDEVMKVFEV